jgi:hypothetical protein
MLQPNRGFSVPMSTYSSVTHLHGSKIERRVSLVQIGAKMAAASSSRDGGGGNGPGHGPGGGCSADPRTQRLVRMRKWVFTRERLRDSPSRRHGIDYQQEIEYGKTACAFIHQLSRKCDM